MYLLFFYRPADYCYWVSAVSMLGSSSPIPTMFLRKERHVRSFLVPNIPLLFTVGDSIQSDLRDLRSDSSKGLCRGDIRVPLLLLSHARLALSFQHSFALAHLALGLRSTFVISCKERHSVSVTRMGVPVMFRFCILTFRFGDSHYCSCSGQTKHCVNISFYLSFEQFWQC